VKRKNIFTLVISIIMVFTVILSSACNKATTTTTATTTQTTTNTTTQTTTKTTTTTTTTPISDVIKPGVTFTSNANGATDVPTNTKIGVFFTEAMNPLTLNTSTFTLTQGTTPVSGKVVYGGGAAATFTPDVNLAANTNYIATITTGAKDVAGNALANSYIWSWTTNAVPDTTPPTVISTYNANGATDVSINTKVGVFFSEIMDPATLTSSTFTLQQGTTPVAGTVILASYTSTFTPAAALAPNTVYTATITTGATDLAGNAMTNSYVWSWTTGGTADTTAPTVSSTIPDNGVTGMAVNSALAAIFSETMDPLTITTVTFTLAQGTTPVSGSVTYIGMTATFTPAVALTTGASYTATITTGVKDLAGNALVANYSWNFTTYSGGGGGGGTLSSDKAFTAFGFILPAVTGVINETAKTIAVTVPFGTNVTALMAAFTTTGTGVKVGTTVQTSLSTLNNFTSPVAYIVTAADNSMATYTATVTIVPNSTKSITAYSFAGYAGAVGTINETAKTIAVTVPFGTPLTALVATFTTTGTVVKVGTTVQTSLSTPNNFTSPVAYIVTAGDASKVTYTVTVTVASNSAKAITAYSFAGYTGALGIINETAKTIAVTVPFGTPLTALVATFATTGTVVKVGTTVQTSVSTPNNFTGPVAYTVTAGDTSTVTYTVTVTVASNSDKAITAYSFAGYTGAVGTINETAKTIAVTVPSGTPLTALVATFITTGTSVKVGTTVQTSLSTPNNFTNPVAYIVTAGDASTVTYTVTVSVTLPQNPTAPVLGETVRFVILASQKVTTTGTTAISNGDIGIIDQARSYYEGFTAGTTPNSFTQLTNGLSYAHDDMPPFTYPAPYASTIAFINQVRTDLGIAYTFLAADPNPGAPTQVCPISLAGLTLTRGVYKTASNVTLAGGNLHLDAQGDPNSVFIISIGGNFTTGSGGNILLENGALAKNVYFRVAGITVIGSASFYGNVFSWQQVNVLAGANITGRLFSVNEQVTLIADTVTKAP